MKLSFPGQSGYSGYSGISGQNGSSGISGYSGRSGYSGTPAGSTKQVQFNSSSSFGGATGFEYQSGSSPNVLIQAQNAAHTPLTVKGASSQSAKLIELQTSAGTVVGSIDVSGNLNLGTSTSSAVATPVYMDLGGTYGNNTPGTTGNLKWLMYNDGSSAKYGIGMSASRMEYQVPSGSVFSFYVNGVKKFEIGNELTYPVDVWQRDSSGGYRAYYETSSTSYYRSANSSGVCHTFRNGSDSDLHYIWHGGRFGGPSDPPATASSTGTTGQITWDSSFVYVCTSTNTWKRAAIATW